MTGLLGDVRLAVRTILRRPGTSLAIVAVLAVGVAANAAMFAGFDAWIVRPLPFADPDKLVAVCESQPKLGRLQHSVAPATFADWREQQRVFSAMAALGRATFVLDDQSEPQNITGAMVSAGLFPLLGVEPVLGRQFLPEEDREGGPRAALIGHRLWERRFGRDPKVLGRTLRLDGTPHQVVGVMPPVFAFPDWVEVWTPLRLPPGDGPRDERRLSVVARMREGVSLAQATADMDRVASGVAALHPGTNRDWGAHVSTLRDSYVPPSIRVALASCLAVGLLVMVIICLNVISLVLARASARERETALRAALGASRPRLARLAITETMLLALAAAGVGFGLGQWLVEWTRHWVPVDPPYLFDFRFDARVLGATLLLAAGAGVVLGLAPVIRAARGDIFSPLRTGGITATASRRGSRFSALLVVGQFGVSVMLAVVALLVVKNFYRQQLVDPGFATSNLVTMRLSLTSTRYADPATRAAFVERLLERLRNVPHVEGAGIASHLPLSSSGYRRIRLDVEGRPSQPGAEPETTVYLVSEGYLETLRMPLRDGRAFKAGELAQGAPVAVVSSSLAEQLWSKASPIGRAIRPLGGDAEWLTVVGVVGDIRPGASMVDAGLRPRAELYLPFRRQPSAALSVALTSRAAPEELAGALRREIRAVDPSLAPSRVLTMDQAIDEVRWVERYLSQVLSLYAALALGIAAIGVYGVTADAVGRRRREMGVRIALGAEPRELTRVFVARGLLLGGTGIGLGLLGALPAAWAAAGMLTTVGPHDPGVFASVGTLMGLVAWLGAYLPARRAARINPIEALRTE